MKIKHTILNQSCPWLVLFTLLTMLFAVPAAADAQTVTVQLAVAGQTESGFSFLSEPAPVEIDSADANVFAALQASGIQYEDMGGYVTSIMGQASSGMDGWQFTVNDTLVSTGAQQSTLVQGDVVLWIYTKGSNDYLMPTWQAMTGTAPANKTLPDALVGDGTGISLEAEGTVLPLSTSPESITYASAGIGGTVLTQSFLTKDEPLVIKEYSLTNLTGTLTNLQITLTDGGIVAAPADPKQPVQFADFMLQVDGTVFRPTAITYTPQAAVSVQFAIVGQDENGFSFLTQPTPLSLADAQEQTALGTLDASGTAYEATDGFVTSIGGLAVEGMDGWQFHVNDTPVSTASDKTVLKDGDTVLWVYSKAANGYLMPTWEALTGDAPANKTQPEALVGDGKSVKLTSSETKLKLNPSPAAVTFACAGASSEILAQSWMTEGEPLPLKTYTLKNLAGSDTNLQVTLKGGAFYLSPVDTKKAVDIKQFSLQIDGVNYRPIAVTYQPAAATPSPTATPNHSGGGRPSGSGGGGTGGVVIQPTATPSPTPDGGDGKPQPTPSSGEFSESDWYYAPTMALIEKNIIKGDADTGAVRPTDTIKREEIASLLVSAYQLPLAPHDDGFTDNTSSDWALDYLRTLKERGIMNGDGAGMQGTQLATRLDVAVLIARMEGIVSGDASILDQFSDAASLPEWARGSVAAMIEKGYLSGYEDGTLRMDQSILRCETFALLYRTIS